MPKVEPYSAQVTWDSEEQTIGIVGVAPWATLDFSRALYSLIDAEKDWHYPRLLIDSNSKIPSRGRYFELNERDPSPFIRDTIEELYEMGASIVVVPCNTAHLLYDRWATHTKAQIPNIIDACCNRVKELGGSIVAVFESLSLRKSHLYADKLKNNQLNYRALEGKDAELIAGFIEHIKKNGTPTEHFSIQFNQLVEKLHQSEVDTIILGCTELSAFLPFVNFNQIKFVDSNTELARAAAILANCKLR